MKIRDLYVLFSLIDKGSSIQAGRMARMIATLAFINNPELREQ